MESTGGQKNRSDRPNKSSWVFWSGLNQKNRFGSINFNHLKIGYKQLAHQLTDQLLIYIFYFIFLNFKNKIIKM